MRPVSLDSGLHCRVQVSRLAPVLLAVLNDVLAACGRLPVRDGAALA